MSDEIDSGIIHALPPAPMFTGRDAHLEQLAATLDDGPGVVSLIGMGGAGKTAIAAEYLHRHASAYARIFVWSFYVDQDASAFLQRAQAYFVSTLAAASPDPQAGAAHGAGALYLLTRTLAALDGPSLIVVDGLERVQRAGGGGGLAAGGPAASAPAGSGLGHSSRGAHGEMEDPLLKRVLTRLAMGAGATRCLITTRFPVTDLHPWAGGRGYNAIDVGHLDVPAARALLRRRGVKGDDRALEGLLAEFGAHALTLDHLGSYVGSFGGGDPAAALALPPAAVQTASPEEARLERVLSAYERALTPTELDLLTRVCVFRFGASSDLLYDLFAKSTNGVAGTLKGMARERFVAALSRLVDLGLISREPGDCFTAHPAVRDHFYRLFADPAKIHGRAVEGMVETLSTGLESEWAKLVESYTTWQQHAEVAEWNAETVRMTGDDFVLKFEAILDRFGQMLPSWAQELNVFLSQLNNGERPEPLDFGCIDNFAADLSDVTTAQFGQFNSDWYPLAQRYESWLELTSTAAASRMARLPLSESAAEIADVIDEFIRRFGDRFSGGSAKLKAFAAEVRAGGRPDVPEMVVRGVSLSGKPGTALPLEKQTLDLLEEVLHHAIRANRPDEAVQVYKGRMGGREHLGKHLGEYARGVRILRSFAKCPEPLDLAWYLRGDGELVEACELFLAVRPIWAGSVLTLAGRLPEARHQRFWEQTRYVTDFLMGQTVRRVPLPYLGWGEVVVDADLCIAWGEPQRAIDVAEEGLGMKGWSSYNAPEHARCRMTMAEAFRRLRNLDAAQDQIDRAEEWVVRSSSVEHLIQLHLVRARVAADRRRHDEAAASLAEGLHLARRCGFGLYHIDLMAESAVQLCQQANASAGNERHRLADAAAALARGALYGVLRAGEGPADPYSPVDPATLIALGATHPNCQYGLGEADARAALGEALLLLGDKAGARKELSRSLELETRIQHPHAERAKELLRG